MKRKITFRAWHKLAHKMVSIDMLDFALDAYRAKAGKSLGSGHLADIELMQNTDLKDRDGQPIYEGDIVMSGLGGNIGEVLFGGYAFRIKSITGQWGGELRMFEFNGLKVIGNIYENAEIKSYPQTYLDNLSNRS